MNTAKVVSNTAKVKGVGYWDVMKELNPNKVTYKPNKAYQKSLAYEEKLAKRRQEQV